MKNKKRQRNEIGQNEQCPKKKSKLLQNQKSSSFKQCQNEKNKLSSSEGFTNDRKSLPVWRMRTKIARAIKEHQVVLIQGDTGSGKSTLVPQIIFASGINGAKCIGITQPRRVAAQSLAARVAQEMGQSVGSLVGYNVRFDSKCSSNTRIKYMTDGMMLRESCVDQLLQRYSVIILDEVHERGINSDTLLGMIKMLLAKRQDNLKLVLMSATVQAERFASFLDAHVVEVPGRQFPVSVMYTNDPVSDYQQAAVNAVLQIHHQEEAGDILVFLTGSDEIEAVKRVINDKLGCSAQTGEEEHGQTARDYDDVDDTELKKQRKAKELLTKQYGSIHNMKVSNHGGKQPIHHNNGMVSSQHNNDDRVEVMNGGESEQDDGEGSSGGVTGYQHWRGSNGQQLQVLCIYAAMSADDQLAVFQPACAGFRKVVLATNIAEASITIPNIKYVVDTGYAKVRAYSAQSHCDLLRVLPINKAAAKQRAGRAGRDGPGVVFRLYPEAAYQQLAAYGVPEIQRSSLGSVVLMLKVLGVKNVLKFPWMDPPPQNAVIRSMHLLYMLKALGDDGNITELGRVMSTLPLDPQQSIMVLSAIAYDCVDDVLCIVAMLSVDGIALQYSVVNVCGFEAQKPTIGADTGTNGLTSPFHREQSNKAIAARRQFFSNRGDLFTYLKIFKSYKAQKQRNKGGWCKEHFISSRAMKTALSIYVQLKKYAQGIDAPKIRKIFNINQIQLDNKSLGYGSQFGGDVHNGGLHDFQNYQIDPSGIDAVPEALANQPSTGSIDHMTRVSKAILHGLFNNACIQQQGVVYRGLLSQSIIALHPTCVLRVQLQTGRNKKRAMPQCIVYNEVVSTNKVFARDVLVVEQEWLVQVAPGVFNANVIAQ